MVGTFSMEKYEDSRVVFEIVIPGDIHTIMDIMALRNNRPFFGFMSNATVLWGELKIYGTNKSFTTAFQAIH